MKRRDFLRILGIAPGALAAGWDPANAQKELISRLVPPDPNVPPDQALAYHSVCAECPAACGQRVTVRQERPIKLEGDPADPYSRGGLCLRGQSSLSGRHRRRRRL